MAAPRTRYRGLVARYCGPILDMPVTEITVDDVAAVLNSKTSRGTPLWRGSDSDGHKLRVFIELALDLAGIEPNPADLKAKLRQLLPKNTNGHGSEGYAWLHPDDLPAFMRELVALGDDEHARVLRWQILTTARPEEARQARWEEIDLKAKTWTLPREKTKKGQRAFVFHLSDAAIAALRRAARVRPRLQRHRGLAQALARDWHDDKMARTGQAAGNLSRLSPLLHGVG